jgi:hypothetical protein
LYESQEGFARSGLVFEEQPQEGVGPVQTTVQDTLTGIVLSSRYTPYGESAGNSLLIAVMKLARVELFSYRTLPLGNVLSMDRGYVPESLLEQARKGCILFVCTSPAKATFPFAQSDSMMLSDTDKRLAVKENVGQMVRWMQEKERTSRVLGSNILQNRVCAHQRSVPRPLNP